VSELRPGSSLRSLAIACLLFVACSLQASPTATVPPPSVAVSPSASTSLTKLPLPIPSDCQPGSPWRDLGTDSEVQGRLKGGELWALVFGSLPLHVGLEYKIVWRMTGSSGDFRIAARSEHGDAARLTFGPDRHSGSSFVRPGAEWGTGFVFPSAGCWRITAVRDVVAGQVFLQVAPS
jgi:hypothetical protein